VGSRKEGAGPGRGVGNRWSRTTFRLDENDGVEGADAIYTCLEQGIAREFDDNPTSSRKEMRSRLRKIESDCSPIVLPPLPTPDSETG